MLYLSFDMFFSKSTILRVAVMFISQCQGMMHLHKSVFQSHGYLSSANCHVDNRWALKVSGFSLHAFRKELSIEQVNINLRSPLPDLR